MNRRHFLATAFGASVGLAGCTESATPPDEEDTPTPRPTDTPSPVSQLTSIGFERIEQEGSILTRGRVNNHGDYTVENATVTITLLNGSTEAASRTINLGDLPPEGSASASATFDIDPARVDGRKVTFGTTS